MATQFTNISYNYTEEQLQQQFFNTGACRGIIFKMENVQGNFYRQLGSQIKLLIQSSKMRELATINDPIVYFFKSHPDKFIYDQNFVDGMFWIGQKLQVTIELNHSCYKKLPLPYNGLPTTVNLMIYQNPQQLNRISFTLDWQEEKPQGLQSTFKFKGLNENKSRSPQSKCDKPQPKFQPNYFGTPNTQFQNSRLFQSVKVQPKTPEIKIINDQVATQNYSFLRAPQNRKSEIVILQNKNSPSQEEDQSIMETQKLNQYFVENNPEQKQDSQMYSHKRVNSVKLENCQVCWDSYKIDNDEAVFTSCCQKNLHKQCYLESINTNGASCSKFCELKCFNCLKEIDLTFLKIHLPQHLYYKISFKQSISLTNQRCFQCQAPLIVTNQEKQICSNCKMEICTRCFKDYHGNDTQCPEIQQYILKSLIGQPIVFCPICNQIQTKDEKCDHVECANCKTSLCSECSCVRQPIIVHGNHFHRVGCKHWKGGENQLTQSEFNRQCQKCLKEGECQKPLSLAEYKKLKNYS